MELDVISSATENTAGAQTVHYRAGVLRDLKGAIERQSYSLSARNYIRVALKAPDPGSRPPGRVTSRYPSLRMGVSMAVPHGWLGLAAIDDIERDDQLVAVFDSPPPIKVRARSASGRSSAHLVRPSFAVVRRAETVLIDVQREDWLTSHAASGCTTYVRGENGTWTCPSAEDEARKLGFRHEVWTEQRFNRCRVRNLRVLEDYFSENPADALCRQDCTNVATAVAQLGAPTFSELLKQPGIAIDDIFRAIARGHVHVDLGADDLTRYNDVKVFPDRSTLDASRNAESAIARATESSAAADFGIEPECELLWDGVAYVVKHLGTSQVGLEHGGAVTMLSRDALGKLIADGTHKPAVAPP